MVRSIHRFGPATETAISSEHLSIWAWSRFSLTVRRKLELVLTGSHWKLWLISQESLQSADSTNLYERCPLRCERHLRVFRPRVIMEARRRMFSPVLSFLLGFVCSFLHACVCFRPGVLHTQNKQNLLFSIVPFIVPFSQLHKWLHCSSVLKRKEGHCQQRSHHFVFCVFLTITLLKVEGKNEFCLCQCVCSFCLISSWTTGQMLLQLSDCNHWKYIYNWFNFGVNPIQHGHHSQLTLKKAQITNSANWTDIELKVSVAAAETNLKHINDQSTFISRTLFNNQQVIDSQYKEQYK